jgi:xanthine phosphoribosyltransferase
MRELIDRIRVEGRHVGGGIVKLDSFLNHQVDPELTRRMGQEFQRRFKEVRAGAVTRVVTAEASGIAVALSTAMAFGAQLIFARKSQSRVMTGTYFVAEAISRTQGSRSDLMIDRRFLTEADRILIVDDFLATGSTLLALCQLVAESGATLAGIGCVVEKPQEEGRSLLREFNVPIITLAKVEFEGQCLTVYE